MGRMMSGLCRNRDTMAAPGDGGRNSVGERALQAKCKNDGEDLRRSEDHEVGLIVGGVGEVAEPLAMAFAERGMNVAIIFWQQRATLASSIKRRVEQTGRRCLLIPGPARDRETPYAFARTSIETILQEFGRLDVFISLSGQPSTKDQGNHSAQDASTLFSAIIPNVPVMKAAMEQII